MIELVNVYKRYAHDDALRGIDLTIAQGSMVFISGHSGAGKTSLLKVIAYMEPITQGQITVNGVDLRKIRPRAVPYFRRQLGMVFQDYRLLMDRTVFDNVALPLIIAGFRHTEIGGRVRAALTRVGLLQKANAYPYSLSGGEQQRVGIARAVVTKPAILLADEPTGNLDPELSIEIMKLFSEFHQIGCTVVIASHDRSLIKRMPYPVYTLQQGQLLPPPNLTRINK